MEDIELPQVARFSHYLLVQYDLMIVVGAVMICSEIFLLSLGFYLRK